MSHTFHLQFTHSHRKLCPPHTIMKICPREAVNFMQFYQPPHNSCISTNIHTNTWWHGRGRGEAKPTNGSLSLAASQSIQWKAGTKIYQLRHYQVPTELSYTRTLKPTTNLQYPKTKYTECRCSCQSIQLPVGGGSEVPMKQVVRACLLAL